MKILKWYWKKKKGFFDQKSPAKLRGLLPKMISLTCKANHFVHSLKTKLEVT